MKQIFGRISVCWHFVSDLYRLFEPARFSFVLIGISLLVFFNVDQGVEVLRSLAEGDPQDGRLRWAQQVCFFGALFYWSWQSWYWPRTLLKFRFPSTPTYARLKAWPFPSLIRHGPRALGVLPEFIIGLACWRASGAYEAGADEGPQNHLREMAVAACVGGVLLYVFFYLRRKLLERSENGVLRSDKPKGSRFTSRWQLPRSTKGVLCVSIALVLTQVVVFTGWPVGSATALGPGAILLMAAAAWICFGSLLVYAGSYYRFPVISALLVLVAISSCFNDNHPVRTLPKPDEPTEEAKKRSAETLKKLSVGEEFSRWLKLMDATQIGGASSEQPYPLFIVTTEGGGIRAAYWTATVLGTLQEADPTFASHVFAISGVSGGSVGSAVFTALLAEAPQDGKYAARMQHMLGRDYLSPPLAAMLHGDFLQRFIPYPFECLDRGRILERAWEAGWREEIYKGMVERDGGKVVARDRFGENMMTLWQDAGPHRWLPALFLNGTCVELGDRVIASNLYVADPYDGAFSYGGEFIDAQGADSEQAYLPMRLSTAAHLSARFTYVSPAGRLKSGRRVVDGGYFENSGAATAWDILRVIEHHKDAKRVRPMVITISNDPSSDQYGVIHAPALQRPPEKASGGKSKTESGNFLSETLSPLDTLLHTREGRGRYAQVQIKRETLMLEKDPKEVEGSDEPPTYFYFGLAARKIPLPLGWMLSRGAAREMADQIGSEKPLNNRKEVARVVSALHRK